ncbi:hypothetical protein GCM10008938_11280 [Deinococcus roseus]|uniref:Uncharacterized protein n=2 Tax=Deinococcus roseus TaxID=392414 RepID=A0ABQ2CW82_9DEIO|nr:hypothetical protein GCM10008938_11280 [Deinococcus roseus]
MFENPEALPLLAGLFLLAFLLVSLIFRSPSPFNPLVYFGLLLLSLLPSTFWVFAFGLMTTALLMGLGWVAVVLWLVMLGTTVVLMARGRDAPLGTFSRLFLTLWLVILLGPLTTPWMLKMACPSQCPL